MTYNPSTNAVLFDLVERAVFHQQCRNAKDVIRYINNSGEFRSPARLDYAVISDLIHDVATQYKASPNA